MLIVWRIFDKQGATTNGPSATTSGVEWGIFIALAAAAFLAYSGSRIRAAHRPEPPLPGEDQAPAGSSAAAPPVLRPGAGRRSGTPAPASPPADPPTRPRPAATTAPRAPTAGRAGAPCRRAVRARRARGSADDAPVEDQAVKRRSEDADGPAAGNGAAQEPTPAE